MTSAEDENPWTLCRQVGAEVRSWRQSHGVRQEDLVEAALSLGLNWSRTSVTQLEAGRRQLLAEELVVLPYLLQTASGGLPAPTVAELLATGLSRKRKLGVGTIALDGNAVRGLLFEGGASIRHAAGLPAQLVAADPKAGEAERKAARRLGLSPSGVVHLSVALWGRTLSAERDHRVADAPDPETTRALRGHVTRQLLAELTEALENQEKT